MIQVLTVSLSGGREATAAEAIRLNKMTKCWPGWRRVAVATALFGAFFPGSVVQAQTSRISERLSPETVMYLEWRGIASFHGAEKKNHVVQLFEDPDLALLRLGLAGSLEKSFAKKGSTTPQLSPAEIISLLESPFVIGMTASEAPQKSSAPDAATSSVGIFIVYNSAGKSEIIQKLNALLKAQSKEAPSTRKYDFEGTQVEVQTKGKDESYTAQAGSYYIFSNHKHLMEDLITRFRGEAAPATSITHVQAYQDTRKYADADASVEFFARNPDVNKLMPSEMKDTSTAHIVQNLHLERFRAAVGTFSFAGEATRSRGAILGDTSAGSLFDVIGTSSATFQTLPVVSGAPIFSITRFNLAALYKVIHGAVEGNLTPQQAASLAMVEAMAQNFLGMSVTDALSLLSGEVASTTSYAEDGSAEQLYAVTIEKPEDILRILRATLASMIAAEDTSAGNTFLDLSYPYKDPVSGTQRRKFLYVGVTPHMVFIAPRKAMVKDAITRLNGSAGTASAGGILADAEFIKLRSALPDKLTALGVNDFRAIPWDKMLASYLNQMQQAQQQLKDYTPPDTSWLKMVKPEIITRHLHVSVGGWWKDPNGVYFDSYVQ
jgi:hypothetical protein